MARLPVHDEAGVPIGELHALTAQDVHDEATMRALTRWREQRGEWFLSRFQPSVERTRNWIANVVARDASRRLFLLFDDADHPVGTIGLLHLDKDPVEVDNILRGERTGHIDLVFHALVAAIRWAFATTPVQAVNLFVLSDNVRACALYRRIGFVDARRFALIPVQHEGEIRLDRGELLPAPTHERHLLEMSLPRSSFVCS